MRNLPLKYYKDNISSELLIKIYNNARRQGRKSKDAVIYKPIRKHYNTHLFG